MSEESLVSDQTQDGSAAEEETKAIDPNDHKRAVSDMLKYKGQVRDLLSTVEELQNKISSTETKALEEQNNFKALYEQSQEKISALESRNNALKESVIADNKLRKVMPFLRKAGLRQDAEDHITPDLLGDMEVEMTTKGQFLVHGAELMADKLTQSHPFFFDKRQTSTINTGVSSGKPTDEAITPAKLVEMSKAVKAGKLDKAEYHKAYQEFQKRKAGV